VGDGEGDPLFESLPELLGVTEGLAPRERLGVEDDDRVEEAVLVPLPVSLPVPLPVGEGVGVGEGVAFPLPVPLAEPLPKGVAE
jgi:hypothetical protein